MTAPASPATPSPTRRPLRLANFSGYLGDRFTALAEVLDGDPV
jgi:hypothetical protein